MSARHVPVTVAGPHELVRIYWEVDGSSGSSEVEAWRCQGEIEAFEAAGYVVTGVEVVG